MYVYNCGEQEDMKARREGQGKGEREEHVAFTERIRSGQQYPATKVGVRAVGFVEAIFPLHDHAQVLVVQYHHLHIQLFNGSRCQLLTIHQE